MNHPGGLSYCRLLRCFFLTLAGGSDQGHHLVLLRRRQRFPSRNHCVMPRRLLPQDGRGITRPMRLCKSGVLTSELAQAQQVRRLPLLRDVRTLTTAYVPLTTNALFLYYLLDLTKRQCHHQLKQLTTVLETPLQENETISPNTFRFPRRPLTNTRGSYSASLLRSLGGCRF